MEGTELALYFVKTMIIIMERVLPMHAVVVYIDIQIWIQNDDFIYFK